MMDDFIFDGIGGKKAKKQDANFVSKLASKGAFVPDVYYNVQVAQSVTISNEDKKYDFYVASRGGGVQDFL